MDMKTGPNAGTVEHWATVKPDETAIIDGDVTLTWQALNRAADKLAQGLARRGIGAGNVVALRMQVRHEWAVAAVALAKLNAMLVGVNWRLTPVEVQYVLQDSQARALLCDDRDPAVLSRALDEIGLGVRISIDVQAEGFESLQDVMDEAAEPMYSQGDAALIVYTSGTTGKPKGVALAYSNRSDDIELLEYLQDLNGSSRACQQDDVVLVSMPLHHGSGPGQIRGGLRAGCRLILQRRFEAEDTLATIQKYGVTRWTGVPTMYKRIAALPPEVLGRYDVSSLRSLTIGAAPVSDGMKAWIVEHFGNILGEGYGSTETGIVSTMPPEMILRKPGSSGRLLRHVHVEVRNTDGKTLPPGEVGELWIRTPMVIRQYLNRPALGRDVLDERGFFSSGDMGRLDEDGYLYITDRSKDMIISGGVNIYPAEIEAALTSHPAVMDAAVIGIPDAEFGESVKAFCELKPGRAATDQELLAHCSQELASYKRPKSIDIVNELPRNAMGKLLKRELREPFWKNQERKV